MLLPVGPVFCSILQSQPCNYSHMNPVYGKITRVMYIITENSLIKNATGILQRYVPLRRFLRRQHYIYIHTLSSITISPAAIEYAK